MRWGMSLLAPCKIRRTHRVLEVRRRRASVRAGTLPLADLFVELAVSTKSSDLFFSPAPELVEVSL